MTEAVQPLYEPDLSENDFEDAELSTAHLATGNLTLVRERDAFDVEGSPRSEQDTDWLALLTRRPTQTAPIFDEPPPAEPQPTGMAGHGRAPVIRPTLWSRVTTWAGRWSRVTLVMCLAAIVIAGATYTAWTSGMIGGVSGQTSSSNVVPGAAGSNTEAGSPSNSGEAPGTETTGASGAQPYPVDDITGTLAERAATLYKEGDYNGAIELLESSVLQEGTDAVAYYQLGLAYLATTGREHAADDAELALRSAISLQPDWGAPYRLLAETMIRRGFYTQAVEFASRATELDPDQSEAWLTLGHAYEGAGQGAEATRAFAEAQRIAPRLPTQP